ncbi:MAG: U32 family peptidase [Methanobrevibacter sp.]|nr:U32 family peptidase [Methanobrevibacter sp.]
MKLPELLAPVSCLDNVEIAIFAGASSIYLSGKKYGARYYSDNLSFDEIETAVKIAHLYNVKVYVTVNTLIKEEEFDEVVKYLVNLYKIGVDSVIVQDIGLIKVIKDILPNFNIHASTQLNIHNSLGLIWAKEMGIKRVVLARELNYNEIKNLVDLTRSIKLELEIFIHGALCFSYSGACSLSFFNGGRSGNRGMCAQPCREKYKISDEEGKDCSNYNKGYFYLLSTKDISLYPKLDELLDLNIDSFKIEGRMRNKDYLATCVNSYRLALNKRKFNRNSKDEKDLIAIENLKLVFNREDSKGYIFDKNHEDLMNTKKVGDNGLYIGKIEKDNSKNITIQLTPNLLYLIERGDGLAIENNNEYVGLDISTKPIFRGEDKKTLIIKKLNKDKKLEIRPNSKVFISKSKSRMQFTHDLVNDRELMKIKKSKISINFDTDKKNHSIVSGFITLTNGKKLSIKKKSDEPWQIARNKAITREILKEQFFKIGKFPFIITSINFNYDENLFTPISQINKFRREFFTEINDLIVNSYLPDDINLVEMKFNSYLNNKNDNNHPDLVNKKNNLSIYINDLDILKLINENHLDFKRVYLEVPYENKEFNKKNKNRKDKININYMVQFIKEAVSISKDRNYDLVWKLDDVAHEELKNGFIKAIAILKKLNIKIGLMTGFLGLDIHLKSNKHELLGSKSLNICNLSSLLNLKDYSILTLSPELSMKDINVFANNYNFIKTNSPDKKLAKPEIIVAGNIEVLRSKIPISDLNSSKEISLDTLKGKSYPIKKDVQGNLNILLNDLDLSLFNDIQFLKSKLIKNFALDCRWKSFKYIKIAYNYYKIAIEKDLTKTETKELHSKLNQELNHILTKFSI